MKVQKISDHIWSLRTWVIIPIHVWVVVDKDGVTLVDAGLPMMAKGIIKFIKELDAGPLQRIVITHGHVDHVGAINFIMKESKVPVYAHRVEIPYMEGDLPYLDSKKAKPTVSKEVIQPLPENENGLATIGGLTPYLTPGHSPGHVVYYQERDQVLLAGDLFTSRWGKLQPPYALYTPDMKEAVRSSSIVGKLEPKRIAVCHGQTIDNPVSQIDEYVRRMEKKLY